VLDEKDVISSLILHGDGITVCNTTSLSEALLLLIALYWTINLNYPDEYAQLLGLVQLLCLNIDFPTSLRSSAFTAIRESLMLLGAVDHFSNVQKQQYPSCIVLSSQ